MTTSPLLLDIPRIEAWLDVSDIARGVGFTTEVQISVTLNDALQPVQNEMDGDYDRVFTMPFGKLTSNSRSTEVKPSHSTLPSRARIGKPGKYLKAVCE